MMKLNYFTKPLLLVVILIAPCVVFSQESIKKHEKAYMHHEVMGDSYKPNAYGKAKTSPGYTFKGTSFFTTQVNVNSSGQNILGDAANEPSLGINPKNPDQMVIGWRQFDDVGNNFRQAGYGYSTDGGETWTFPGVIDQGVFRSDPVLDTDSSGVFYYNSLTKDAGNNYTCQVFRSYDGGVTWDAGTYAQGGDKQWMVIDKSGGMGDGNIYAFWTYYYSICNPGAFTRSTNKGDSFEDCVTLDGQPHWGTLAVGPDGELYTVGANDFGGIVVTKSMIAQDPLYPVSWDFTSEVNLDGQLTGWSTVNPEGLIGQANIVVDNSEGQSRGNVYVLASVTRASNFDPADVMFARSSDGGVTWSEPVRINNDQNETNYQWFGTMSVAPDGRIDVIWLDTRDNIPGFTNSALYYSSSFDQGTTWTENLKLSELFDSQVGWPNQSKMGDYYHMISTNNAAHFAWANTLNGEQDVYYGRVTIETIGNEELTAAGKSLGFSAFPNPFGEKTNLQYTLPQAGNVSLTLCDVYGNVVKTLINEFQTAGLHKYTLASEVPAAGLYYCRLSSGNSSTIKVVIIK
jgi:hypothetical protein